jgi:DNA-binding GntR family transcriptional regulator
METISNVSLVDQVYEILLNRILKNEYTYGDTLSVKVISEDLGISTMPVREAIKRLEYDGIVDIKPRSSCVIKMHTEEELKEIYELREVLEIFAINKFLANFDPVKLKKLEKITKLMGGLHKIKDETTREHESMVLDYEFHIELCNLSGNSYNANYHRLLLLHNNMACIHKKSYLGLKKQYFKSHKIIVEKLKEGSDEATTMLQQHFQNVWKFL